MERHELEESMDKLILVSGVPLEEVIDTLESMLLRYQDQLDDEAAAKE